MSQLNKTLALSSCLAIMMGSHQAPPATASDNGSPGKLVRLLLAQEAEDPSGDGDIMFDRGKAKLDKQDYSGAIEDFARVIEKSPKSADARYDRGFAYFRMHNLKSAIADFDAAITIRPKYANALLLRGMAKKESNDLAGAIDDLTEASAESAGKTGAQALLHRGMVRQEQQNHTAAIDDFNAALTKDPGMAKAYLDRGYSERVLNQHDKARQDYDKAIELDPKLTLAYINRGYLKTLSKDYKSALEDFNTAVTLNPKSRLAYRDRGKCKAALGDDDGAIADYNMALQLGTDNAPGNTSNFKAGLATNSNANNAATPRITLTAEQMKLTDAYMAALQPYIKSFWSCPKNAESKKACVYFKESISGELSNIAIRLSSGNDAYDAAAKAAVEKATPLPAPPPFLKPPLEILFTFDYNVLPKK